MEMFSMFFITLITLLSTSYCQNTIILDEIEGGVFTSPHYPEYYSNNVDQKYLVEAPENHIVVLTFTTFWLEDWKDGERTDDLRIVDGKKSESSRPEFLYGNKIVPFTRVSKSNYFRLRFRTNGHFNYKGFKGSYLFLDKAKFCEIITLPSSTSTPTCIDKIEGFAKQCSIESGNYTAVYNCTEGNFVQVEVKLLDEMLRKCEDTDLMDCPYSLDEILNYYEFHELGNTGLTFEEIEEEDESAAQGVSGAGRGSCPRSLCYINRNKEFIQPKKCGKFKKTLLRVICVRCRYQIGCGAKAQYLG